MVVMDTLLLDQSIFFQEAVEHCNVTRNGELISSDYIHTISFTNPFPGWCPICETTLYIHDVLDDGIYEEKVPAYSTALHL